MFQKISAYHIKFNTFRKCKTSTLSKSEASSNDNFNDGEKYETPMRQDMLRLHFNTLMRHLEIHAVHFHTLHTLTSYISEYLEKKCFLLMIDSTF